MIEMSLTSFVKTPEILKHILAEWPVPPLTLGGPILAPPLSRNYGLVGTAFDYLLRFHVKHLYPKAVEKRWVAEYATNPRLLVGAILIRAQRDGLSKSETKRLAEKIRKEIMTSLETSRKEYTKFIASGKPTDDFLRSVIKLAQLDPIYRAGYLDPKIGIVDPQDLADLRRLYELVPPSLFSGRTDILLNPTFPIGSELVGGADCDVVLDGNLLDFKTTKFLEMKNEYWAQLLGYAVLADLTACAGESSYRLKSIGVYFCRHGITWTYPINGFYKCPKYPAFRTWFVEQARRAFPSEGAESFPIPALNSKGVL